MSIHQIGWSRLAWRLVLAFVAGTLLLLYVPPTPIGIAICATAALLTLMAPPKELTLLVSTGVLLTLVFEVAARLLEDGALAAHYRPHEVLADGAQYQPSRSITMDVAHGDLIAVDPSLPKELAEPRVEVFRTDSLGFRNDADYSGERLLVVGDSFVAANGTSQEHTITNQLRSTHGIAGYNLGFASGPLGYSKRIQWARREFPPEACLVLVFFEGNDFQPMQASDVAMHENVPSGLQSMVRGYITAVRQPFQLSRVTYGLWTRALANFRSETNQASSEQHAIVRQVGGRPMGFLRGYAEVTQRTSYDDFGFIEARLAEATPDLLMFIPDKFRVYGPLAEDDPAGDLPEAQWNYLAQLAGKFGVPAVNATEALRARAAELLPAGEVIYWRDDTHWNAAGIAVGAQVLADALKAHPQEKCRIVEP